MTEIFNTILTVFISSVVSFIVARRTIKSDERRAIHEKLDDILNIAIEYPYLEDELFTSQFSKQNLSDPDAKIRNKNLRYEYYGIKVFNYIESYGKYHDWMITDMEREMNLEEWVKIHIKFWEYISISDGYCYELKHLIKRYKDKWQSEEKQ